MTTTEKIQAVQTLASELTKTVYNGSVAVVSSAGIGECLLSVSASEVISPSESFSVECDFIYNGLATDAERPTDSPLIEAGFSGGLNAGLDLASEIYFAAQSGGMFEGNPANILSSVAGTLVEGQSYRFKYKVTYGENVTIALLVNGAEILTATAPASAATGTFGLYFKGVDVSVTATKAYTQAGVFLFGLKGANAISAPYWYGLTAAFAPSSEVLTVTSLNEASASLISVYLEMAAQRMISRIYPFDPSKTVADLPSNYDMLQVELASRYYARAGAEGEIAHHENGINRTYKSVDDEDILARLTPYCKAW